MQRTQIDPRWQDIDVIERLVREAQAQGRIPALTVAVHRADRPLWTLQVGTSGRAEQPLDAATMFRMGSVTKTFTAVLNGLKRKVEGTP